MQRYNIALLPTDADLQKEIIRISRHYFLKTQDEYILGNEGLPHITLCQFKTDNFEIAKTAYNDFAALGAETTPEITIEKFNARPGKLVNSGKFMVEYKAVLDDHLRALQRRCSDLLSKHGLTNLTPCEGYSPHITLARLSEMPKETPTTQDLPCPFNFSTTLSLGLSTEAGIFVKSLL